MRKITSILLAFVLALTLMPTAWAEGETTSVAKIGEKEYATLKAAIDAVQSGETITLLCDVDDANGMTVSSGKNFTVDFAGYTYTVSKPGAGSKNTETNAFQLLKDSTVTFKSGTIKCDSDNLTESKTEGVKNIYRIIQNYAELTLENMVIDGTNLFGDGNLPMSFNHQPVTITGNTSVILKEGATRAFDADGNWGKQPYDRCKVTVDTTGTIGGNIELGQGYLDIKNANIEGGIVLCTSCGESETEDQASRITISGGTFGSDPSAYLAAGYTATNANDKWTVSKTTETESAATVTATTKTENGTTKTTITAITAKEDTTASTTTTTIDVSNKVTLDSSNKTAEVKVSKTELEKVVTTTAEKPVEFKVAKDTSVTFNTAAVKSIAGKMNDATNVTLVVTPNAAVTVENETNALNSVKNSNAQTVKLELLGKDGENLFTTATGAKATVTVPFTMPAGNNTVNVYYLNATTGTAEYVGTATVGSGTATFTVSHFSSYVLVPTTVSTGRHYSAVLANKTADTTTETKSSPKTFDAGVGIYAVSAILSVTGMAWVGKKKF